MSEDKIVTIEPCHACQSMMRIFLDIGLNGNHIITCPNCGHEHYRVVKDGIVTEGRWGSPGPIYLATVYYVATDNQSSINYLTASWMGTSSSSYGGTY